MSLDLSTSKINAIKDKDSLRFMISIWLNDKKVLYVNGKYKKEIVGYIKKEGLHFWILEDGHHLSFRELKEYIIESKYFKVDQTN